MCGLTGPVLKRKLPQELPQYTTSFDDQARAAAHDAVTKGRAMAREQFWPTGSIYDASPAEQLRAAPRARGRRRLVKPIGILAALAAIAAGAVTYMAIGHAAAAPNPNCTIIVPANPLSAAGLATPYQLTATNPNNGPCNEANAAQSAFVQGAIIDANGAITLYNPLVIDRGTQPAAAPAAANVPAGSTVALWFGLNGTNLTLR